MLNKPSDEGSLINLSNAVVIKEDYQSNFKNIGVLPSQDIKDVPSNKNEAKKIDKKSKVQKIKSKIQQESKVISKTHMLEIRTLNKLLKYFKCDIDKEENSVLTVKSTSKDLDKSKEKEFHINIDLLIEDLSKLNKSKAKQNIMISQEIQTNEIINLKDQDSISNTKTTNINETLKVVSNNLNENNILDSSENQISAELTKSNKTGVGSNKIITTNITPIQQLEVNSDQPKELKNVTNKEEYKLINNNTEIPNSRSTEETKVDSCQTSPLKNENKFPPVDITESSSSIVNISSKAINSDKSASNTTPKFNFDDLEEMSDLMDSDLEAEVEITDQKNTKVKVQSENQENLNRLSQLPNSNSVVISKENKDLDLFINDDEMNFKEDEIDSLELSMKKTRSNVIKIDNINITSQGSYESLSQQESSKMLLQLIKERENYKEKLRVAKREIQIRDGHIERMKSEVKILPLDMTKARLHLAFMFSSPLIRKINGKIESIMQLDYNTEIDDIVKVLSKIKSEMKFKTDVATVSNLRSTITDCPIALHFSGHGIRNTPESLGTEFYLNKDKGNILLLEDEQGMSSYFFENDLKYMIEMSQTTFEVVFVSSCHSQFAGEVFLNAGAKHVICIRGGEKISDKASLRFSKVFYETLFVKNYNVCTSFYIAKEEINKVINSTEASKFMLLIQEYDQCESVYNPNSGSTKKHRCYALTNFKEGKLTCMDNKPMFDSNPTNVEGFIGRQQEMYEIINLLESHRLVSILGPPGIGKTSLSRNLANYLKDRRKFSDGIIFVGLRGCESAQMFLIRLTLILRSSCCLDDYKKYGLEEIDKKNKDNKDKEKKNNEDDEGKYRIFIINLLKDKEALMILDNAEDPLEDDNARFILELETIIDCCKRIKFLLTTRKTVNKLAYNQEKPYILCPLSKEASLKLLIAKAPREIKKQEIHDLLYSPIPEACKIGQSLNITSLTQNSNQARTLLNHPFTMLLGGHPQAISLAAPLLEYKSLKELFYAFCSSNLMDALDISPDNQNANTSLRVSLELSISHMRNTTPEALDLFGFVGLLPGGVTEVELTQMWGNTDWMNLKDALIRASLLVYKNNNDGFIYSMLPFMTIRAYEYLETKEELKASYHIKCCKMYKEYCIQFYYSNKQLQDIENLVGHEANIWACIYRSLNKKKDVIYQENNKCDSNTNNKQESSQNIEEGQSSTISTKLDGTEEFISNIQNPDDFLLVNRGIIMEQNESDKNELESISEHGDMQLKVVNANKRQNYCSSNKYFEEETLVIYYTTDLISLNKNVDALKAINEYLQKSEISQICLANLFKSKAILCLISKENRNPNEAISLLEEAASLFKKCDTINGAGICYFGISKIYYEYWPELLEIQSERRENSILEGKNNKNSNLEMTEEGYLENSLKYCQKALKLFAKVKCPIGEYYCGKLEDTLKKKMKRKDIIHKPVKYYKELGLLANSEKGLHQCSPFINTEIAILLEVILSDTPFDPQAIQKVEKAKTALKHYKVKHKKTDSYDNQDTRSSKMKGQKSKTDDDNNDFDGNKQIELKTQSNIKSTNHNGKRMTKVTKGIMGKNKEIEYQKELLEQFSTKASNVDYPKQSKSGYSKPKKNINMI